MDLGGAALHTFKSGVSDHIAPDERSAPGRLRDMVGALAYAQPFENKITAARPPLFDAAEIPGIVGTDLSRPFDPREIIPRSVAGIASHAFTPAAAETPDFSPAPTKAAHDD